MNNYSFYVFRIPTVLSSPPTSVAPSYSAVPTALKSNPLITNSLPPMCSSPILKNSSSITNSPPPISSSPVFKSSSPVLKNNSPITNPPPPMSTSFNEDHPISTSRPSHFKRPFQYTLLPDQLELEDDMNHDNFLAKRSKTLLTTVCHHLT